jgi:hypothetical protein
MSFELSHLQGLGDKIQVAIPMDERGFLGRECPEQNCLGYFKVKPGTGLSGPDLACHCPYCGHSGSSDTFWTPDQVAYAGSVALRQITEAVDEDLKSLEFDIKAKGSFGIGISMKLQSGTPVPIRFYRERTLETDVACEACSLEYSVFGLFAVCPDCGQHNSKAILLKNLTLTRRQLELAATLADADFRRHIIEDALENCVSAFDGFARESCRVRRMVSADPIKAENISFQNLTKADKRLRTLFGVQFESEVAPGDWAIASRCFMKRHVIAHRSGVVDQQYLDEANDSAAVVGRRISVEPSEVEALATAVERIAGTLLSLLPSQSQ